MNAAAHTAETTVTIRIANTDTAVHTGNDDLVNIVTRWTFTLAGEEFGGSVFQFRAALTTVESGEGSGTFATLMTQNRETIDAVQVGGDMDDFEHAESHLVLLDRFADAAAAWYRGIVARAA